MGSGRRKFPTALKAFGAPGLLPALARVRSRENYLADANITLVIYSPQSSR